MERLWSPWRMEYVGAARSEGCIFCDHAASDDGPGSGVLYRASTTFVVVNAYPYNSGHLMVAPLRHAAELGDLDDGERHDLMDLTASTVAVLRDALAPDGFNVGMNLGDVAGAGVPGHLHVHVVPRWRGDTNFMPVVSETKVLPEMVEETYAKLRPAFTDPLPL